jgi:glycosyltransferase involved in cell wall biosynthesis
LVDRDEDMFANNLEKLLTDDSLWSTLAKNSRPSVLKNWTWEKSTERLEEIMKRTLI